MIMIDIEYFIVIQPIHSFFLSMLSFYSKSFQKLVSTSIRCFSTSFDALAREHKLLAANLQKIAETDRKFVSFEVQYLL